MIDSEISFQAPYSLILLLLTPFIGVTFRHLRQRLGLFRTCLAVAVRMAMVLLIVLALSDPYVAKSTHRVTAVFLIDQSDSISSDRRDDAIAYVKHSIRQQPRRDRGDLAAVIAFGRQPVVEIPPMEDLNGWNGQIEGRIDSSQTNMEAAIKLARSVASDGGVQRIVLISDGNETQGNARGAMSQIRDAGFQLDFVSITSNRSTDIELTRFESPSRIGVGQAIEPRVVLTFQSDAQDAPPVTGVLRITSRKGPDSRLVSEESIELRPGPNIFTFKDHFEVTGFYSYEASFIPSDSKADRYPQNNIASTYVEVGTGQRVLVLVEEGREAEFKELADLLTLERMTVDIKPCPLNANGFGDLQRYDLVILADIPRFVQGNPEIGLTLSTGQLEGLEAMVEKQGTGLLMIGGTSSFGAGEWKETVIERMMPVDFDVKNRTIQAVTALMLVIDHSGSMQGIKMSMSITAAKAALVNLKETDYIGVVSFDQSYTDVVRLQKAAYKDFFRTQIANIGSGGGTDLYPAMEHAYSVLKKNEAAVRHMIILTDGLTPPNRYAELAEEIKNAGISVSTLGIGVDADHNLLSTLAQRARGQYYRVMSPSAIPSILIRETRRIARPLIYENGSGIVAHTRPQHQILDRISTDFPQLTGYVLTTPKDNPLVELPLVANLPADEQFPLVATWQYGLGRSAVWATDFGQRWSSRWRGWEPSQRLFVQLSQWLARQNAVNDRYQLVTKVHDEYVDVILTTRERDGTPITFLAPIAQLIDPALKARPLSLKETGPGYYFARTQLDQTGTYSAMVALGQGEGIIRSGFAVQYSNEFRIQPPSTTVFGQLAHTIPGGGKESTFTTLPDREQLQSLSTNHFRDGPPGRATPEPVWHLAILIVTLCFMADVANRKITWIETLIEHCRYVLSGFRWSPTKALAAKRLSSPSKSMGLEFEADQSLIVSNSHVGPGSAGSPSNSTISPLPFHDAEMSYTDRLKHAKREATAKR